MLHPVVNFLLRDTMLYPKLVLQLNVQKLILLEEIGISGVLKQFQVACFHVVKTLEEYFLAQLPAELGAAFHFSFFVALLLAGQLFLIASLFLELRLREVLPL